MKISPFKFSCLAQFGSWTHPIMTSPNSYLRLLPCWWLVGIQVTPHQQSTLILNLRRINIIDCEANDLFLLWMIHFNETMNQTKLFVFFFSFFVLMTHFESSKWNLTYFLKLKQSIVHMLSSWLSTLATRHPCSVYF